MDCHLMMTYCKMDPTEKISDFFSNKQARGWNSEQPSAALDP